MIDLKKLTVEEILDIRRQLLELGFLNVPQRNGNYAACGRPKKHDYESWDWSKQNISLAREHGCSTTNVGLWRKKLGHGKQTKWWPKCKAWDWSKPDAQISRETGAEIPTVRGCRIKLNMPPAPRDYVSQTVTLVPAKNELVNWNVVDWSKADVDLARDCGVSRERVRQIRAKLGKPKAYKCDVKFKAFTEKYKGVKSLRFSDVASECGVSETTFAQYCSRLGIERMKKKKPFILPWEKMNFDLPNVILQRIWRVSGTQVANHRCNHTIKPPVFRCWKGRVPDEFKALVEQEEKAAELHFSES